VPARTDLVGFLNARLDWDEEELAHRWMQANTDTNALSDESWQQIRRLERDVAAKRAIVRLADEANWLDVDADRGARRRDLAQQPYVGDLILRHLAVVYSDHPDYRDEWRP
jgi:hypothetical protein